MRILLDENLDWRLSRHLLGHDVQAVSLIGWAGITNGELLARAERQFDILITMDSNLPVQQDLSKLALAVIVLQAPSNRLADTRPLMPRVLVILPKLQPGSFTIVESESKA